LVLLRHQQSEVPFSPDGPLTWNEIDLVRTDVFTPALVGLLPPRASRACARWTAATAAIQELTDMEKIEEGKVECKLEGKVTLDRRPHARVAFAGTIRGVNEDGPNRQELEGYYLFDLEAKCLTYLYLKGSQELLDKDGKSQGKVNGHFVLTRRIKENCKEL